MHKILKNLTIAIGITSIAATAALADITFSLTPYDISGGTGVEIVGGSLTTNGTVGNDLALGTILTDWSITLTNGITNTTLTPLNSFISSSSGSVMDVEPYYITFDSSEGMTGAFQVTSNDSQSFYAWYTAGGNSYLHVGVAGSFDSTSPAPSELGSVASIPEPSTVALWFAGFVGMFVFWQKRRKA